MYKVLLGILSLFFVLLIWVQIQQTKGGEIDNAAMQQAVRAHAIERYGEYNE